LQFWRFLQLYTSVNKLLNSVFLDFLKPLKSGEPYKIAILATFEAFKSVNKLLNCVFSDFLKPLKSGEPSKITILATLKFLEV